MDAVGMAMLLASVPPAVATSDTFQLLMRRVVDRVGALNDAVDAFDGGVSATDALIAAATSYRDVLNDVVASSAAVLAEAAGSESKTVQ